MYFFVNKFHPHKTFKQATPEPLLPKQEPQLTNPQWIQRQSECDQGKQREIAAELQGSLRSQEGTHVACLMCYSQHSVPKNVP